MSWEEYKKKRNKKDNEVTVVNNSKSETSSWEEYKQRREQSKAESRIQNKMDRLYEKAPTAQNNTEKSLIYQSPLKASNINKNNVLDNLSNMSSGQRVAMIHSMTSNQKDFDKLNQDAIQYQQEKEAQEKANKINQDMANGKYGSAIGHVLSGIPQKALDSTTTTFASLNSLVAPNRINQVMPNENELLKTNRALTSKYENTTSKIDNDIVKTASNISGTIGGMVPSIVANIALPGSGAIVQGLNVGAGSYQDTLNDDATNKLQATTTGIAKGTISGLIEKITGGNLIGKGSLDDVASNFIANKFKGKTGQWLASKAYEMIGEIGEENLENQAGYIIDKIINGKDITAKEWWNEATETTKNTFLTTVVLNLLGLGGSTYNDVKNAELDLQAQKYIKEAEEIIKNENFNNNTSNLQQNQVNNNNNLQTQQTIQTQNQVAKNSISEQTEGMLNNKELPMQSYQYEMTGNTKVDSFNKSASMYFNNSEKSRNFLKMLEKVIIDKNIEIRFDANLKTTDERIANGSYSNGVITINPNSTRAGEFIAIHELTHAIGTKEMLNMINTYRNSNAEFDTAVKGLLKNYQGTEITEEALSDVAGQLFGNQEFINNIAQNNPNIFQKLYSEIKYLWHQFRGYKNQNQFVEDLYYKWTQAYNSNNKLNGTSNYSIAGINAVNNIKNNTSLYNEAMSNYNIAKNMARQGKNNTEIIEKTGWFKDDTGKLKFSFSDKYMDLKNINFQENRIYELEDILEHDTLFMFYPELRKYKVEFKDLNKNRKSTDSRINGAFSRKDKEIRLDIKRANSKIDTEGTLIHEIQHAIQNIEGFARGTSTKLGKRQYQKSLGEREARDTASRFINEKYNKVDMSNVLPESAIFNRNILDKMKDGLYNYLNKFNQGVSNEEISEINEKDYERNKILVVDGINEQRNSNESSFSMQDNQGRTLTKEQQEYFKDSKVRDEKGNLLTMYHGTPNGSHNVFKNGGYFTSRKEYADGYQNTWASAISTKQDNSNPRTYEVYLNIKNPFTLSNPKAKDIYINEYIKGGNSLYYDPYTDWTNDINNLDEIDWTEGEDLKEWIQENHPEYDGLVLDEGGDGGYGEAEYSWRGKSYVPFNSNQIKNVDNSKPTNNPDIRYSISEDAESGIQALEKYEKNKKQVYKKMADEFGGGANFWEANLDGQDRDYAIRMLKRQDNVKNKFIENNKFEKVYKPVEYSRFKTQEMQDFIKNNNITSFKDLVNDEKLVNEYFDLWFGEKETLNDYTKQAYESWKDLFDSQKEIYSRNGETIRTLKSFERDIDNINNGVTEIVDEYETGKKLENMPEFDKYVEQFVNPLYNTKPQLSTEELTELAQDTFGTTTDFKVGAYMTPDGKLLNFRDSKSQYRNDHRGIASIGYNMQEFIDAGNIRMKPEGNGFELTLEPTSEQYDTLSDYIDNLNGEVYVEIDIGNNKYDGANYKAGTSTSKIISDLQYYFRNGKFPAKSEFADFRYSQNNKTWQQYLDENFKPTGTRTSMQDILPTAKTQNNIQNVAPTAENNVAPTAEYKPKNKLNPTEIANLTMEDADTTPELRQKHYAKGNKQSSFFRNVIEDAQFLNKDLRQEMSQDENIRYYKGITNAETLEKAYTELQKGGQNETLKWFNKESKDISPEDVVKGWILLKQYQDKGNHQSAVEVAKKMRNIGTKAGQAVQAYNILSRLTPEGMFYYAQSELSEAYNKMAEGKSKEWISDNKSKFDLTPEETQIIKEKMESIQGIEDERTKKIALAEIQKIITDKIPPTASQSIKSWMRISMLFNPKTQVRNVAGNAVILPVNMASDFIASGIDRAISKKTGVRTTGNTNLKNYAKGFGKGIYESYDDFRKGINTKNIEGNRFEVTEGKNFKDKGIGKALNRVDNMLSFMLDAGDRGFYEATFTNSINNQLVLNNTTKVTADMIDIATQEALQRTWQDNNSYTNAVLKIRKLLNFNKGYGLGDILIPFAKTPANLTKAIVDYSPVGLTKTLAIDARKLNNSLQNGQYTPQLQHKFVQDLGKGMAGSLLYVLGYALAKAGVITGEADDDKDVKNFMKNSLGINSYSIKIGDKTFAYDWAQPVATPFAIMTNFEKYNRENPDASAIDKAINSINIGSEQLLQQSFMESINTVLNGNGTFIENLSQSILELPSRAIPTLSKQITDMVDGTQRTSFEYGKPVDSAINAVKAKIPGLSQTLAPSVDTLGNEIQKYGGDNNIWNVMFNPANMNKGKLSKAGEEIYNVYMETGDATLLPRTAPYYIDSKGEKKTMTSTQRSEFQKITGKYVESTINGLLINKDYKKLSNDKKAELINEIVSDSYSKAKYDVLKIDSEQYEKLRNTLKNVSTTSYYDYKSKTEEVKKDSEKLEVLVDANYTKKEKQTLYENYIKSSTDEKYDIIKTVNNFNISTYLEYKLASSNGEFSADKKDDGTVSGKTISGSAKNKKYDYIINMKNTPYMQKVIMFGLENTPSKTDKSTIVNYISSLPGKTNKQKLEILDEFSWITIYKDGRIKY